MKKTAQILFIFISINCFNSCNSGNKSNTKINEELQKIQPNDEIVTDIDGNKYETIKIGNNIWFASNLKATRFSNGDKIPNIKEDETWKKNNGPAYCFFNNDIKNYDFGCLYNLYTVIDKKNICPKGWHVASNEDWGIWSEEKGNLTSFNLKDKLFNNKILGWRRIQDDVDYFVEGNINKNPNFNSFELETKFNNGGSAIYWTSSIYFDENYDTKNPTDSIIRGINRLSDGGGEYGWGYRNDGFPCRCVKDSIKN